VVVSNADFFHTYFTLLDKEALPTLARWRPAPVPVWDERFSDLCGAEPDLS
jgi:hypothetical protein